MLGAGGGRATTLTGQSVQAEYPTQQQEATPKASERAREEGAPSERYCSLQTRPLEGPEIKVAVRYLTVPRHSNGPRDHELRDPSPVITRLALVPISFQPLEKHEPGTHSGGGVREIICVAHTPQKSLLYIAPDILVICFREDEWRTRAHAP